MASDKVVLVNNMEDRLHNLGNHITLKPGVNEVPADKWAEVMKITLIKDHYVAKGIFKIIEENASIENPLLGLNTVKAIEMVQDTYEPALLESWLANDAIKKRSRVVEAINLQLEMIALKTAPKEADTTAKIVE